MQKKAFSLIELLIVVLIIGVVYTLSVTKFQKVGAESNLLSLKTLKEFLHSQKYKINSKLICIENCSECFLVLDGKKDTKQKEKFKNFLDDSVEIFQYDHLKGFSEAPLDVYFNKENVEESVCFSYSINKQGIGDQVYVHFKEKVYDFTSPIYKTKIYNSLDEVSQMKENLYQEVLQ